MKKETCIISERLGIGQYQLDLGDGHHERFSDLHRRPSQTFAFEITGYFKIESFLRRRSISNSNPKTIRLNILGIRAL